MGAYLFSAELKEWKWIDGTPFEFENWDIDQPIHNPAEGCVEFVNGKWHDFPCDFPRAFICQKTNGNNQMKFFKTSKMKKKLNISLFENFMFPT